MFSFRKHCIKDLGIVIDSKLSFTNHINKILKQVCYTAYQLLKILKTHDLDNLIFAYNTYIRPIPEYSTGIWIKTKQNIAKLE